MKSLFPIATILLALLADDVKLAAQDPPTSSAQESTNPENMIRRQERLAEQVEQLESRLLRLIQFESPTNPERARLLQQSLQLSQSAELVARSRQIVKLLRDGATVDLEAAVDNQKQLLTNLNRLYELLESSNQLQSSRNEAEKIRNQISRLDQLIQQQQGIRQRLEVSPRSVLENEQRRLADQTQGLSREITDPAAEPAKESPDRSAPNEQPRLDDAVNPAEATPQEKSVEDHLESAGQSMQQATERLANPDGGPPAADMEQAEQQLGQARQQLEDKLRQNREEEIESTLRTLEERFKKMLAMQLKINEASRQLVDQPPSTAQLRIESFQLAGDQRKIILEIDKALLVLNEEGTSRAIPATLFHLELDMEQIVSQLELTRVDADLIQLQTEVAEVLSELIQSVQQEQAEQQRLRNSTQQPATETETGEMQRPLVQKLAELKIIRQLQVRINERHQSHARALESGGTPESRSELEARTRGLARRQQQLEKMTLELIQSLPQSP